MGKKVSVDNLTLVGNLVVSKFDSLLEKDTRYINKRYRSSNYKYDWTYQMVGGVIFEVGKRKGENNCRLEFNPNKVVTEEQKELIQTLINCMKYVEPSRVDVAIDIRGVDMNDYVIIDDKSRKRHYYVDGVGRMETTYIGLGDLVLRIYDKAKEREKEGIEVKGSWWRIESQLRGKLVKHYKYFNPYEDITLVPKNAKLEHIKSFKERVFINHLLENPNDLSQLAKNTRYKYKKILKELADSNSTIDFKSIYEEYKSEINWTLYTYIKHSRINDIV